MTDRQTYFFYIRKSHYKLNCHRHERDKYRPKYMDIQDGYLLRSHDNIHGMTYIIKIMLNTGYFYNTNDYCLK